MYLFSLWPTDEDKFHMNNDNHYACEHNAIALSSLFSQLPPAHNLGNNIFPQPRHRLSKQDHFEHLLHNVVPLNFDCALFA